MHITVHGQRPLAKISCRRSGGLLIMVGDDDRRTLVGQPAGGGCSDPVCRSGDECNLTVESHALSVNDSTLPWVAVDNRRMAFVITMMRTGPRYPVH
jgi:hypothetical protein